MTNLIITIFFITLVTSVTCTMVLLNLKSKEIDRTIENLLLKVVEIESSLRLRVSGSELSIFHLQSKLGALTDFVKTRHNEIEIKIDILKDIVFTLEKKSSNKIKIDDLKQMIDSLEKNFLLQINDLKEQLLNQDSER